MSERNGGRPLTIQGFVARFQPSCLGRDEQETQELWRARACPSFARAIEAIGGSAEQGRDSTFAMLRQSSRRLETAGNATRALARDLDPGILSVLVAGSAARGEAIESSDIDFNVCVTEDYMVSLHSRRDHKARTPYELLRNYEQRLRLQVEDELRGQLKGAGYDPGGGHLTMKPFAAEQLTEADDPKLGLLHLLNLLFGATPVYGADPFEELLGELLGSTTARGGALLGRIALLRCRGAAVLGEPWIFETPTRAGGKSEPEPGAGAHAVAACISAVIAASLGREDPQMPYWCTFEEVGAIVEMGTRSALEQFLARVTLVRGGVMPASIGLLGESLETALAVLPAAVDAILDHLAAHGADEDTLAMWDMVQDYLFDPLLAQQLAVDLGLC